MPLTLSGTNGVSGIDGSAGTPTERGSDADTGVFYPSAGNIAISTNGTEALRVDSSGNLGLGVTPSAWLSSFKATQIGNGAAISGRTNASSQIYVTSNAYIDSGATWRYLASDYAVRYYHDSGKHIWDTAPSGTAGAAITFTPAMTLDSSGNLLVGTTSVGAYTGAAVTLSRDSGTTKWSVGPTSGTPTNFWIASSGSTGVYLNGTSATSWTSNSDERIKENLSPIDNALNKTLTLRTVTGNFIEDETKTPHAFLLAQDVLAVLPEAVDTSNPNKYGLAYSEVIPLAIAAIKELSAKNDALEARIAALEAN
jgi:hypothetical protein